VDVEVTPAATGYPTRRRLTAVSSAAVTSSPGGLRKATARVIPELEALLEQTDPDTTCCRFIGRMHRAVRWQDGQVDVAEPAHRAMSMPVSRRQRSTPSHSLSPSQKRRRPLGERSMPSSRLIRS
jgi:hypothetical protein